MEWIKCSEQLPCFDKLVLLHGKDHFVDTRSLDKDLFEKTGKYEWWDGTEHNEKINYNYYWCELPKFPDQNPIMLKLKCKDFQKW